MDTDSNTPPEQPTAALTPIVRIRKLRLPVRLQVALLIFALASGVSTALIPLFGQLLGNGDQPTLLQLALTGVVLIGLTTVLLSYASKVVGFSRAWLILALTYNAMIIIVKFVISPASLYGQTFTVDRSLASFDPNYASGYIFVGSLIMLVYLIVFAIIHSVYAKRVRRALALPVPADEMQYPIWHSQIWHSLSHRSRFFLGLVLLIGGSATGLLVYPLASAVMAARYLAYSFAGMGLALLIALAVAVFTAVEAFDQAKDTAIELKDASILATFLWLGLSLILIYHVLWVIYMTVMLSIWPFKTISPSGK